MAPKSGANEVNLALKMREKRYNISIRIRWSSYMDYTGQPNFPSILSTALFTDSPGNYARELREYLKSVESEEFDLLGIPYLE